MSWWQKIIPERWRAGSQADGANESPTTDDAAPSEESKENAAERENAVQDKSVDETTLDTDRQTDWSHLDPSNAKSKTEGSTEDSATERPARDHSPAEASLSLAHRLAETNKSEIPTWNVVPERPMSEEKHFQQVKAQVHQQLVRSLDLSLISSVDDEDFRDELRELMKDVKQSVAPSLSQEDTDRLMDEMETELFSVGPLEPLLDDPLITDILANNAHEVFIERAGKLYLTNIVFADDEHLLRVIRRVVARSGRRIDESNAMIDARLPDGSRVNAIIPPVALDGPKLSIRRFGATRFGLSDLTERGLLSGPMADFLAKAVEARLSILVSGGTGAGKSTLLGALASKIPQQERVVTIEDAAELQLDHPHVARLETRLPNAEGTGTISARELVRNSLRMRPDRILVGEVRGAEAFDMLQAMNTGHTGSMTTIHANGAADALLRLEMMMGLVGTEFPLAAVRHYISSAIDLVVHIERRRDGSRRAMMVGELVGLDDGQYQLRPLFYFDPQASDEGEFRAFGETPDALLTRMKSAGVGLNDHWFDADANHADKQEASQTLLTLDPEAPTTIDQDLEKTEPSEQAQETTSQDSTSEDQSEEPTEDQESAEPTTTEATLPMQTLPSTMTGNSAQSSTQKAMLRRKHKQRTGKAKRGQRAGSAKLKSAKPRRRPASATQDGG